MSSVARLAQSLGALVLRALGLSRASGRHAGSPVPRMRRAVAVLAVAALAATGLTVVGLASPRTAEAATDGPVTLTVSYVDQSTPEGSELTYDGNTVLVPGIEYKATFSYVLHNDAGAAVEPGSSVTITLPAGVTVPDAVPDGNENVASVSQTGQELTITFEDAFTSDQQGYIEFLFTVAEPDDGSGLQNLEWKLNDVSESKTVIVAGDDFDPSGIPSSAGLSKSGALSSAAQGAVTYTAASGTVAVDDLVESAGAMGYTVTVNVPAGAADSLTISDVLDDRLVYDASSFSQTVTTWTEYGDKVVGAAESVTPTINGVANSFSLDVSEVQGPAVVTVTYTAHVGDADAIADLLQGTGAEPGTGTDPSVRSLDDINSEVNDSIWVKFGNAATTTVTPTNATAEVQLGANIDAEPQPNVGPAFGKSLESESETVLNPDGLSDGDGNPDYSTVLPLTTDYTLTANLGAFNDTGDAWLPKWDLTDNVVLKDTLPNGLTWDAATLATNSELTLLDGTDVPAAVSGTPYEDTFAAETDAGDYWIDAATRTLWINLGQDTTTTWSIDIAVVLDDADALALLPTWNKNDPQVVISRYIANQAQYFYWDGRNTDGHVKHQQNRDAAHRDLFVVRDDSAEIVDDKAFNKTIGTVGRMTPGEAYQVPFTFTFSADAVVDWSATSILDHVNHDVFDVTDANLSDILATFSGTYGGIAVDGDDFELALDDDTRDLVITTSASFPADPGEALTLNFELPTHVIQGKQTLDITNSATVQGETKLHYTWGNEATGSATSYGNELEVFKAAYSKSGWTQNLRVELDDDGLPVSDTFIYRVELRPHGTFNNSILPITDVLPADTTFVGFITDAALQADGFDPADAASHVTAGNSIDIDDGRLTVAYDSARGTVDVTQKSGMVSANRPAPAVNFVVTINSFNDIDDLVADLGVINRIGPSQATITPTNGYPLQILKTDSQRANVVISDRDARFTITGPNGFEVVDAFVADGQLMVEDADGIHGIVVPGIGDDGDEVPDGDYCITEVTPPAGYDLPTVTVPCNGGVAHAVATIKDDGSSNAITIANDPQPLYAIGDYTWIDDDRDGVQDDDEPVLPGVTVELLTVDGDGNATAYLDGDGNPVTTTTDEHGFYLFDLLPEGDYKVRFTLTDEQKETYTFTDTLQGGDVENDSDADRATGESGVITLDEDNAQLVSADEYAAQDPNHLPVKALLGVDPTWDAGVVEKTYAIGDFTWIDANRNGAQDTDEDVLPGVTVELLDADGNTAKDIDGVDVPADTTDVDGYYQFDNLPAGEYQIRFTLTDDQSELYVYTRTDGGAAGTNSDATPDATDQAVGLTELITLGDSSPLIAADEYAETISDNDAVEATEGIDSTWDAGVVTRSYAIGDYTWIDANRDGIQDLTEEVLIGVIVDLLDENGDPILDEDDNPVTTATDDNGLYLFDELPAGNYKVRFTLTEDQAKKYNFTGLNAIDEGDPEFDPNADSDSIVDADDPTTGVTAVIELGPNNGNLTRLGEYDGLRFRATDGIDPTWDAGVVQKTYAVGDVTWIDSDRDGVQDDDEPVLPGVTVDLLDENGDPILDGAGDPVSTETDENGYYQFDDLPGGKYQLKFTLTPEQAAKYTFTDVNRTPADDNSENDSDAARDTGLTVVFTLDDDSPLVSAEDYAAEFPGTDPVNASQGIDPRWDAGVVEKTYAVGDVTWIDSDRDGVQDDDEPVLPGVTVELLDENGDPILDESDEPVTTTTDSHGRYLFDNLPAGTYRIKFTLTPEQAAKYRFTVTGKGTHGTDSDADNAGLTPAFELGNGNPDLTTGYSDQPFETTEGVDPTWDAGVVERTYGVGDYVWIDEDRDGVQDPNEPVLPGVTVELQDKDGKTVATTTTDSRGRYLFDNLPAGTYRIQFTLTPEQAAKYEFTVTEKGSHGTDSDAGNGGLTPFFELGDDNPDLTTDYSDQPFSASEGVDPTWDAGVVTIEVGDAGGNIGGGDPLAHTGSDITGMVRLALLTLLAGLGLLLVGGRFGGFHRAL